MNAPTDFNNEEILTKLDKRIKDFASGYRRNIALIGPESSGKTSMLNFSLQSIYNDKITPFYINLDGLSFSEFVNEFSTTLLIAYLKKHSNIEGKPNLYALLELAKPLIPETTAKIEQVLSLLSKKKYNDTFKELILLMDCLACESSVLVMVVLDEFHVMSDFPVKNIYREWGKIICLQRDVLYMLSSSACFKARNIFAQDLQLLFGNFEVIEVLPLEHEKAGKFVLKELYPLTINTVYAGFLADFFDGQPCFLKLATSVIAKNALIANTKDVNSEIFKKSIEEIIFKDMGLLNQKFSHMIDVILKDALGKKLVQLLIAISLGNSRVKDLSLSLKSSTKSVNQRLSFLLETDLVVKNGNFFKISSKMFSFWIKSVYQQRFKRMDAIERYKIFSNDLSVMIENYILSSKQNIVDRVMELFNLFTDGIINIEAKSLKLAHFREVKPIDFDSGKGVIARAGGVLWLAAVKEGNIKEEDVIRFSVDCKKFKTSKPKKVILGYNHIDTNAKILAKQENITIIDRPNLNKILDLYNRPGLMGNLLKNEDYSTV
jgi:hypothetical protein